MSLPDSSYPKDELDRLVKGALNTRVSGQEPPSRVWKRIQRELDPGGPRQRRLRTAWPTLVLQAALMLLLLMMGGVGLRTLLNADSLLDNTSDELRPSVTIAYVDERTTTSTGGLPISDEADVRLLRTLSRPSPEQKPAAEAASKPPILVPPDVPPRAMSLEVRARKVDLSQLGPPAEERNRLHGGPYQWFR